MKIRIPAARRAAAAFAILAALAALPCQAGTFRFVQISDTHQGRALHQWRYREAIKQINALPFPVECVVHTGDVLSNGIKSHDVAAAASNLLASIEAPTIVCPGNHDIIFQYSDPTNRFLRGAAAWPSYFGPLGQSVETDNALYLTVFTESLRRRAAPDVPGFDPLAWLEERLAACPPDKPVFVATHVPDCDDYQNGNFVPAWENAENRAAWRALLRRHPNVKAVLAGHFHRNAYAQHPEGGPPTVVASCFAGFWGRQASYRIYTVEDGALSWQDCYIEDPPVDAKITHDGFLVVDPISDTPAPAAPVDTTTETAPAPAAP